MHTHMHMHTRSSSPPPLPKAYRDREVAKLRKEKRVFQSHREAMRQLPNKRDRETIAALEEEVHRLTEQLQTQERRAIASRRRQDERIRALQAENEQLQEELLFMERERVHAGRSGADHKHTAAAKRMSAQTAKRTKQNGAATTHRSSCHDSDDDGDDGDGDGGDDNNSKHNDDVGNDSEATVENGDSASHASPGHQKTRKEQDRGVDDVGGGVVGGGEHGHANGVPVVRSESAPAAGAHEASQARRGDVRASSSPDAASTSGKRRYKRFVCLAVCLAGLFGGLFGWLAASVRARLSFCLAPWLTPGSIPTSHPEGGASASQMTVTLPVFASSGKTVRQLQDGSTETTFKNGTVKVWLPQLFAALCTCQLCMLARGKPAVIEMASCQLLCSHVW